MNVNDKTSLYIKWDTRLNADCNYPLPYYIIFQVSGTLFVYVGTYVRFCPSLLIVESLKLYDLFQGLKTGMYYLRTKPAAAAIQVTVDKTKLNRNITGETNSNANGTVEAEVKNAEEDAFNLNAMVCSLQNKDECLMCGS
jgi:hypothetical protein